MGNARWWTALFLIIATQCLTGQSIGFSYTMSVDDALRLAKENRKNILVDVYADWCMPCKKMDREFEKSNVRQFFNDFYINIKVNADHSPFANEIKQKYEVVFLPTIIILDPYGNVKFKTDKVIDGDELVSIAEKSLNPNIFFEPDAAKVETVASNNGKDEPKAAKTESKILYKSGNDYNPDFLYKEAYFRIELMDGSHRKTANKYLETQTDWSTEKNIKFIYDFVYTTQSAEFQYLVENVDLFKRIIGTEEINKTITILVQNELNVGYPRPDFDRAKHLYSLIDVEQAEGLTYQYFFQRYFEECNLTAFKKLADEYLKKYNSTDKQMYNTLVDYCVTENQTKEGLTQCTKLTEDAIKLDQNCTNVYLFYHLSEMYYRLGNKGKAQKNLERAIDLATQYKHNLESFKVLEQKIKGL